MASAAGPAHLVSKSSTVPAQPESRAGDPPALYARAEAPGRDGAGWVGIGRGLKVRDRAGRGGRGAVGQACAGSRRTAVVQSGAGNMGRRWDRSGCVSGGEVGVIVMLCRSAPLAA